VQEFIHAKQAHEIIFTRGTTEGINLVAFSFGEAFCKEGDEVILTTMEHHSNIVPWQMLAERKGLRLKIVRLTDDGQLDLEQLYSLFSERTRLLTLTHVSNVLGTVNPVKDIIENAHRHNIPVLVDGAQSIPHLPVDVQALDADFYLFSAHKVYGPTGMGVLYGKEEWLNRMPPYQGGGEMIAQVTFEKTTYNELPYKFEAGTPDYIGSTALAEAIRFVNRIGMDEIVQHEKALIAYALQRLTKIDGMRIFGPGAEQRSGVISFLVGNIHPYDLGMLLDKLGIAVRTGHHCAQPLMQALGVEGTVRASFALYNTKEEIDLLAEGIERVAKMF
jgi:cysteine desulfurase/selenocysteine lyase